ncbi:MAG: TetR/AcrR family transcriptional regulator [Deltaproteobacteria bacterium]|nr:TetR/AcrR family transcriptional regulator [Deltaproteobacteria bacterium]
MSINTVVTDMKTRILDAAVTVFSEKGFRTSTLSDLAETARIGDATLYNHFSNKEDILLSIPIPHMRKFLADVKEQFAGIKNPEEKLRKFIWHYLWWSQKQQNFVKVLIFDIYSNPKYYCSDAYDLAELVADVPASFLAEGKKQGFFREEVSPHVFRKFLMGTMDYLFLTGLVSDRPFQPLNDYEALAEAIVASIKKDQEVISSDIQTIEEKKEHILIAAEQKLAEKPFAQVSISEIAKKANVADGTIYEYFENKEDILFSVYKKHMEDFTETFLESLRPSKSETKLKLMLGHFLSWIQNRNEWGLIYLRDIIFNQRFYRSKAHDAMRRHDQIIVQVFDEGKQAGVFRKGMKNYLLRALVFGPLHALCYPGAALQKNDNLLNYLEELNGLVFRAIKTADESLKSVHSMDAQPGV